MGSSLLFADQLVGGHLLDFRACLDFPAGRIGSIDELRREAEFNRQYSGLCGSLEFECAIRCSIAGLIRRLDGIESGFEERSHECRNDAHLHARDFVNCREAQRYWLGSVPRIDTGPGIRGDLWVPCDDGIQEFRRGSQCLLIGTNEGKLGLPVVHRLDTRFNEAG